MHPTHSTELRHDPGFRQTGQESASAQSEREQGRRHLGKAPRPASGQVVLAPRYHPCNYGTAFQICKAPRVHGTRVWGVEPTDPLTFAGVAMGLLGVAVMASTLPALRVLRVLRLDPSVTLRAE